MIYTINKINNPYNGLNVHLRALQELRLTKHLYGDSALADKGLEYADLIILGNFMPNEVAAIKNNTGKRIGYLYCSPFGQAFTNGELPLLGDLVMLKEKRLLDYIFVGDKDIADVIDQVNIHHLPAVSDFEGTYAPPHKRSGILLLGNNLRPSRNFANQIAAIKLVQQDGYDEEIVSIGMPSDAYMFFRDLFGIKNWTNVTDFLTEEEKAKVIATAKLGLQVTYSDGFNIAAYEHALCHIPCLISMSLHWGITDLRVSQVDAPKSIARSIKAVLDWDKQTITTVGDKFRAEARRAMKVNFEISDKTLRKCL